MAAVLAMRVLGFSALGGAAVGTAQYQRDEGLQRSIKFWRTAMPTYLHYRLVEYQVQSKSDLEQAEAYQRLNERYSPVLENLVYSLRGFYLKLIQVGSTRDEFMPEEFMRWAKKTQDSVPSELTGPEVRETIAKSLGRPFDSIFADLEDSPVGAASIGQVHRGTLLDGRKVAVKVQYPRIEERFRSDVTTSMRFAKLFQPHQVPFMEEVERQFQTEFDYRGEAENLRVIRESVLPAYGHRIAIPEPIVDLCTKHVLVMEFIEGVRLVDGIRNQLQQLAKRMGKSLEELEAEEVKKVSEAPQQSLESVRLKLLVVNLLTYFSDLLQNAMRWIANNTVGLVGFPRFEYVEPLRLLNLADILALVIDVHGYQALIGGSFNADPHPGNILLCPDGKLALLDYGQVKSLTLEQRIRYSRLVEALHRGNRREIIDVYKKELGFRSTKMDPEVTYRRACFFHDRDTLDVTYGLNIQLFMEEVERLDPIIAVGEEFIMLGRLNFLLRGLGNAFGVSVHISDYWHKFASQLLHDNGTS